MAELSPLGRLVRKRNSNLQKQLEGTVQILSEEYRQTKERLYKEKRDCGKFLQSLYSTVPGLHTYGQPDTRAMNANAMLKERRYSMSASVLSGSDGDDLHNHLDPPFKPLAQTSTKAADPRPKSSKQVDCGALGFILKASGNKTCSTEGSSRQTSSERNGSAQRRGEGEKFVNKPRTACAQKDNHVRCSVRQDSPEKTASGFSHSRMSSPRYGKNAYTDHDRFIQEKVLKKFDYIFDPETDARKVNLSTFATHTVALEAENEGSNNSRSERHTTTSNNMRIPHPHTNMIRVNGGEFHLTNKSPSFRRVKWSSHPHWKKRAASAPNTPRAECPTPEMPRTARPASSGVQSSSLTALTASPKSLTAFVSPLHPHHPDRLHSRIQSLALHRNLPAKSGNREESESSSESDRDEQSQKTVKQNQKRSEKPQAHPLVHTKKSSPFQKRREEQTHAKSHSPVQQNRQQDQTQASRNSLSLLKVPVAHHVPPDQRPSRTPSDTHRGPSQGVAGCKNAILRPSFRLSDTSDRTPPVELWSKLMKAGLPDRAGRRPMTAPSKSELTHRSMPVPRQTVVGILAQIENQKANTQVMIDTSRQLQKVVKNLVPWGQSSAYDLDDW